MLINLNISLPSPPVYYIFNMFLTVSVFYYPSLEHYPRLIYMTNFFFNFLSSDLRQTPVSMSPSYRGPFTQTEIVLLFMYVFVLLVGTVGNGLVIKTFYANRDRPGSRYVLVLAMIDLITSIWIPLVNIGKIVTTISHNFSSWPFGKIACYLRLFEFSLPAASAWLLIAICLERVR